MRITPRLSEIEKINMQELTSIELKEMGILSEGESMILFRGKQFSRDPSFSLRNRQIGVSFCEREERRGCKFLLVENESSVTVWKEISNVLNNANNLIPELNEQLFREYNFDKTVFLEYCREQLTKCIGLMASLVIDELVADPTLLTPTQCLDRIDNQIPDAKLATQFRSNITW